jgi:hypothetical protein
MSGLHFPAAGLSSGASGFWEMVSKHADALVGEYTVEGKNEQSDFYEGKATISSKRSGCYLVS